MTPPPEPPPPPLDIERVVAEIPHPGCAALPWRWFEIDLDRVPDPALLCDPPPAPSDPGRRVSGMTRHWRPERIARLLERPRTPALTHVQFEARHTADARRAADAVRAAGLIPLPAAHLSRPPGPGELLRALEMLCALGAPLVKLAYPAPTPRHVHMGTALLTAHRSGGHPELALVPMGTLTGRAAAVAAGSRLLWAPPHREADRWGADELLPLLTDNRNGEPR